MKTTSINFLTTLVVVFISASMALPAFAQSAVGTGPTGSAVSTGPTSSTVGTGPTGAPAGALVNPLNVSTIQALLAEVMQFVVTLGSILLTLMIIYVGFLFVSARGNEEAIKKARTALLWTIIGGLILLGASAIASVIAATANALTS